MTDSLVDTIEPKSDQINADDLITGPLTVRVESVKRSTSPDQPIDIIIAGHRPFRPCKSMRRVLISIWGDKGADWVGESMTLYRDPNVKYGGVAVGGIRISHMTRMNNPVDLMLTTTRAKRSKYTVKPLIITPTDYPEADFAKNLSGWISAVVDGKIDIPGILQRSAKKGAMSTQQRERLEEAITQHTQDKQT